MEEARRPEKYAEGWAVGMDETSKNGHNYITVMVDLKKRKVIFVTEGKNHATVDHFVSDYTEHGGVTDNVKRHHLQYVTWLQERDS